MNIPDSHSDKVRRVFGEKGETWLGKLPDLLKEFIEKWELTDWRPLEEQTVNFICYARSPKYGEVVLKTGAPHRELFTGMDALRIFGGNHACRLYEADRERGIMLLERICPGTWLKDERDFLKRMSIGTGLVKKLPAPIHGQHEFPAFREQMDKAFEKARKEGRAGREFLSMLSVAEGLYREISSSGRPKVLLHGDLHHENILLDSSGKWKVIDPQGRIGEQCLETGRFLLNEWKWFGGIGDAVQVAKCINIVAEALNESPRTVAISCFLDYALSRCWSLEEGRGPEVIEEAVVQMRCLLDIMR